MTNKEIQDIEERFAHSVRRLSSCVKRRSSKPATANSESNEPKTSSCQKPDEILRYRPALASGH